MVCRHACAHQIAIKNKPPRNPNAAPEAFRNVGASHSPIQRSSSEVPLIQRHLCLVVRRCSRPRPVSVSYPSQIRQLSLEIFSSPTKGSCETETTYLRSSHSD